MKSIWCFLGLHKRKTTEEVTASDLGIVASDLGIAGGQHCVRPGCDWKIDPIKWPRPKPLPKSE